jgi:hypothetical protein
LIGIDKNEMHILRKVEQMFKKIVLWTVFAGLAAVLVVGAINRTNSKSDQAEEVRTTGRGQMGEGRVGDQDELYEVGQGGNGRNRGGDQPTQQNGKLKEQAQKNDTEWISYSASVVEVNQETLTLEQVDGAQLVIEGRAWRYAQESGFTAAPGHEVHVKGFYEEGEFKLGTMEDLTTRASVEVRDESGRPLWSGRGRRST